MSQRLYVTTSTPSPPTDATATATPTPQVLAVPDADGTLSVRRYDGVKTEKDIYRWVEYHFPDAQHSIRKASPATFLGLRVGSG